MHVCHAVSINSAEIAAFCHAVSSKFLRLFLNSSLLFFLMLFKEDDPQECVGILLFSVIARDLRFGP
jgi:hypothetical protein